MRLVSCEPVPQYDVMCFVDCTYLYISQSPLTRNITPVLHKAPRSPLCMPLCPRAERGDETSFTQTPTLFIHISPFPETRDAHNKTVDCGMARHMRAQLKPSSLRGRRAPWASAGSKGAGSKWSRPPPREPPHPPREPPHPPRAPPPWPNRCRTSLLMQRSIIVPIRHGGAVGPRRAQSGAKKSSA